MRRLTAALLCFSTVTLHAEPIRYEFDPAHTYPSFEADHMGISLWRGKFNHTTGSLTLDRAAGSGTVEAVVDLGSVDFGHDEMNAMARGDAFFDVARFPSARYRGRLVDFVDGAPTRVVGVLDLHGVSAPVELRINRFKCVPHPLLKRELCGADAFAEFERDVFGLTAGRDHGFDMTVTLRIQMEAVAEAAH